MADAKKKRGSRFLRAGIGILTGCLVILISVMIYVVSGIQGTARVVNYAGLVRGGTQRMIKMENAGSPQETLLESIESYIDGLQRGSDELNLVKLNDRAFQDKMEELAAYFQKLKQEIQKVREEGCGQTDIISMSEEFFKICDEAVNLAEVYSQKKASQLDTIEKLIIADIMGLIVLTAAELIKALRYAALSRILQKKVYLDEATGLPNKNKCEELLNVPELVTALTGVCVFDLNNLRVINNSMGHEKGDEYIRRFATLLREAVPEEYFVGRDGGDEFIAIINGLDHDGMDQCLEAIRKHTAEYSAVHTDMPISYAAGYALSSDFDECTMRTLLAGADKNMYINKNHMKLEEAALERKLDQQLLRKVNALGHAFSDCLYCDARRDMYRTVRRSENFFLASSGNYSGAVEQISGEYADPKDRKRVRGQLQLSWIREHITPEHPVSELTYAFAKKDEGMYGRITIVFVDQNGTGELHHFLLAFESVRQNASESADAKQYLVQYYEQLKQSILENENYAEALLETADTVYSINLTENRLEKIFFKKGEKEQQADLFDLGLSIPCSYDEYCEKRAKYISPDTLEGFRLVNTAGKLLERFDADNKQVTVEYSERNVDGTMRWVQKIVLMSESMVYDKVSEKEKNIVHGMVLLKNTTDLHRQEQKELDRLKAAWEEADTANREKTEFLSRMSHDIRTPINGVMGMLEMIRRNRQDEEKVDSCLEKIQISAEHLLTLINNVLDMSKLEAGHIELDHIPFDLEDVIKAAYVLNEAQLAQSGITYERRQEPLVHTKVVGSPLHLRQVLLNLFNNAMKYNKPEGRIDTSVREISFDGTTVVYEFKIADTGVGMSKEFLVKHLFEPFTQEKNDARTHYKGTGLGMAIVKELTEKMGGSIEAESTQGVGSTFTVTLPLEVDLSQGAERTEKIEETQEPSAEWNLTGLHILLVEDNELNMEIAEFMLLEKGASVEKAWNGKEAVEAFAASKPGTISCILMDIMMPVMDGLEAARRIRRMEREDAKAIPIVAVTANAFSDDVKHSREAGMNDHLSKPLEMEKVAETVCRLCHREA